MSGSIEKYVTPTSSREENKVDRGKNLKTDLEKKGSEDIAEKSVEENKVSVMCGEVQPPIQVNDDTAVPEIFEEKEVTASLDEKQNNQ